MNHRYNVTLLRKGRFKGYTMQEVLGELDLIECFEVPGQRLQLGETTKHQLDLYSELRVTTPASLQ